MMCSVPPYMYIFTVQVLSTLGLDKLFVRHYVYYGWAEQL